MKYRRIACCKMKRLIQKRKMETTKDETRWMKFKHHYKLQRRKLYQVVHGKDLFLFNS